MRATFDLTTTEGQLRAFNAQTGASVSLKKLENGEVIDVVAVMQYEDTVDSYGQAQQATITVLFAKDGTSYAGVSATVADAGAKLINLFEATGLETIGVAVIKEKSATDKEFLNLRVVI